MTHPDARLSNRYQLGARLGRGALTDVFAGRDVLLHRPVTIKVLHPELAADEGFLARFVRAARSAAALNDAGIATVLDIGAHGELRYLITELVEGRTLAAVLAADGPLAPARAAGLIGQAAAALAAAHEHGIIHGDIHPGNIIVSSDDRVKVTDFGIGRAGGPGVVASAYTAPEAHGGPATPSSDLYALSVCLHQALTGHTPGGSVSPGLPGRLGAVVTRALAADPDHRFETASELRDQLALATAGPDEDAVALDDVLAAPAASDAGVAPVSGTGAPGADVSLELVGAGVGAVAAADDGPRVTPPVRAGHASAVPPAPGDRADAGRIGAGQGPTFRLARPADAGGGARPAAPSTGAAGWAEPGRSRPFELASATGSLVTDAPEAPAAGKPGAEQPPPGRTRRGGHLVLGALVAVLVFAVSWLVLRPGGVGPAGDGSGLVAMPTVAGMSAEGARAALEALGLEVSEARTAHGLIPVGDAVTTDPRPGEPVRPGRAVTLFLSSGPASGPVPSVVASDAAQAQADLIASGFPATLRPVESDRPAGTVLAQDPRAGQRLRSRRPVVLTVSKGPKGAQGGTGGGVAPPATTTAGPPTTAAPPPGDDDDDGGPGRDPDGGGTPGTVPPTTLPPVTSPPTTVPEPPVTIGPGGDDNGRGGESTLDAVVDAVVDMLPVVPMPLLVP
jgi:serine/threonine-protein kinase